MTFPAIWVSVSLTQRLRERCACLIPRATLLLPGCAAAVLRGFPGSRRPRCVLWWHHMWFRCAMQFEVPPSTTAAVARRLRQHQVNGGLCGADDRQRRSQRRSRRCACLFCTLANLLFSAYSSLHHDQEKHIFCGSVFRPVMILNA